MVAERSRMPKLAKLAESLNSEETREANIFLRQLSINVVSTVNEEADVIIVGSRCLKEALQFASNGLRVIGVECLRQCVIQKVDLPLRKAPVLSSLIRGKTICLSGISQAEKAHLTTLVEAMGGVISPGLTLDVTHLVASHLETEKCKEAVSQIRKGRLSATVVSPAWIKECWSENEVKDELPYCLRLNVFDGKRMTCTGFDITTRTMVSQLAKDYGAQFVCDLDSKCSYLIALSASGKKYEYAVKHRIPVVSLQWLEDSCRRFDCLDLTDAASYSVKVDCDGQNGNSSQAISCASAHSVPVTPCIGDNSDGIDKAVATWNLAVQASDTNISQQTMQNDEEPTFFEGLKFFIAADLSPAQNNELTILCRRGGGTYLLEGSGWDPCAIRGVTHFIASTKELSEKDFALLEAFDYPPVCVIADWVRDCARLGACLPTEKYISKKPESPLEDVPKLEAKTMSRAITRKPSKSLSSLSFSQDSQPSDASGPLKDEPTKAVAPSVHKLNPEDGEKATPKCSQIDRLQGVSRESSLDRIPPSLSSDCMTSNDHRASAANQGLFDGLTFLVSSKFDSDLVQKIQLRGGKILHTRPNLAEPPADFEVRKLGSVEEVRKVVSAGHFGRPKLPMNKLNNDSKVVSEYWVRKCVATGQLIDIQSSSAYRPLSHPLPISNLEAVDLVITGAHGEMKEVVIWLAREIGATFREGNRMQRKRTTHLIVFKGSKGPTDKETTARTWGIPLVSLEWLEECAVKGMVVSDTHSFAPYSQLSSGQATSDHHLGTDCEVKPESQLKPEMPVESKYDLRSPPPTSKPKSTPVANFVVEPVFEALAASGWGRKRKEESGKHGSKYPELMPEPRCSQVPAARDTHQSHSRPSAPAHKGHPAPAPRSPPQQPAAHQRGLRSPAGAGVGWSECVGAGLDKILASIAPATAESHPTPAHPPHSTSTAHDSVDAAVSLEPCTPVTEPRPPPRSRTSPIRKQTSVCAGLSTLDAVKTSCSLEASLQPEVCALDAANGRDGGTVSDAGQHGCVEASDGGETHSMRTRSGKKQAQGAGGASHRGEWQGLEQVLATITSMAPLGTSRETRRKRPAPNTVSAPALSPVPASAEPAGRPASAGASRGAGAIRSNKGRGGDEWEGEEVAGVEEGESLMQRIVYDDADLIDGKRELLQGVRLRSRRLHAAAAHGEASAASVSQGDVPTPTRLKRRRGSGSASAAPQPALMTRRQSSGARAAAAAAAASAGGA